MDQHSIFITIQFFGIQTTSLFPFSLTLSSSWWNHACASFQLFLPNADNESAVYYNMCTQKQNKNNPQKHFIQSTRNKNLCLSISFSQYNDQHSIFFQYKRDCMCVCVRVCVYAYSGALLYRFCWLKHEMKRHRAVDFYCLFISNFG